MTKKYNLTISPYVEGYVKDIRDAYIAWSNQELENKSFWVPVPQNPFTSGLTGPLLFSQNSDLSLTLFSKETIPLNKGSNAVLIKNTLLPAYIDVLKPSWILDNTLASIITTYGESSLMRKGCTILDIERDPHLSLIEITLALYRMYEAVRDTQKLKNHWSIYPCMLCSETHPYILDELRRRVTKPSRVYVLEQAIKVKRYPTVFYNWVVRNSTMISLSDKKEGSAADFIAKNLHPFLTNTQVY